MAAQDTPDAAERRAAIGRVRSWLGNTAVGDDARVHGVSGVLSTDDLAVLLAERDALALALRAAEARAVAAEAERDAAVTGHAALAAAVGEAIANERRASERLGRAQAERDGVLLECGEREEAAMAALDVAANEFVAARNALDALLRGAPGDYVAARVVRAFLDALDATTPGAYDREREARAALEAALAAAGCP